jgi:NAD-dependent histone deacetylase SIR2
MEPKERTTEHFDLRSFNEEGSSAEESPGYPQFVRLVKALHTKRKIVVIAGAGISVSAGSQSSYSFFCSY